jgi:hypothetical protein
MRRIGVLASSVVAGCALVVCPAFAQQGVFSPAKLPGSIDKTVESSGYMLVIPEPQIFNGVDLTPTQRAALSINLRKANFEIAAQKVLKPEEIASQQLKTGQMLKTMQNFNPPPGSIGLGDGCSLPDYSDAQLSAFRTLLVRQLQAQSGDVEGFQKNEPTTCKRTRMIYYMTSATLVAK